MDIWISDLSPKPKFIHLSMHPLTFTYPDLGGGGSILSREVRTSFSPAISSSSCGRMPKPDDICSLSSVFWVCLVVFSQFNMPETPPTRGVQEASCPDAWTSSTDSCHCGGAATLRVSSGWLDDPILKGESRHPMEETYFSHLYLQTSSFTLHSSSS